MTNSAGAVVTTGFIGGQPGRLYGLAFGEAFDRFAYYGMQSLLFLYLEATLSARGAGQGGGGSAIWGLDLLRALLRALGEHGGPAQVAAMLFGLFTGAIYLTTLLGGWAADRFLGARGAAMLGGLLGAAGYALLAVEPTFLLGLALLAIGSGAFRGNLAAELSSVYAADDPRRAAGYRFYFFAVMLGVLAAPVVCGGLAHKLGWRWGFAAGGIGMLCGAALYMATGRREAAPQRLRAVEARPAREGWTPRKAAATGLLLVILAVNLTGAQQLYAAYMAWAEKGLVLRLAGQTLPPTVLLALDSVLMLVALWIVGGFWRIWRRHGREPSSPVKIGLGCLLVAAAYVCLALIRARSGPATYAWVAAFHMLNGLGFAVVNPVALDFLTRSAPEGWRSRMASLFYLQFAIGSFLAGGLGQLFGQMPTPLFWLTHTALFGAAGSVALVAGPWIQRTLEPPKPLAARAPASPSKREPRPEALAA